MHRPASAATHERVRSASWAAGLVRPRSLPRPSRQPPGRRYSAATAGLPRPTRPAILGFRAPYKGEAEPHVLPLLPLPPPAPPSATTLTPRAALPLAAAAAGPSAAARFRQRRHPIPRVLLLAG